MKKLFFLLLLLTAFLGTRECQAVSVTVAYTYDDINRLTQVAYQSGLNVLYVYDAAGNITDVNSNQTPVVTAPGAPTITSIVAGPGRATIYFTAPASNGGSAITSYTATCTATGYETQTATGPGSPLTVGNLVGGVDYDCSVSATNDAGTSSASASMGITPSIKSDFPWNLFLPTIIRGVK